MVDDEIEFLLSLISLLSHFFHVLKKAISMTLCSNGNLTPWKRLSDPPASSHKRMKEKEASSEKGIEVNLKGYAHVGVDSLKIDALERKDVEGLDMVVPEVKVARKLRRRPAKIVIPELLAVSGFGEMDKGKDDAVEKDVEVEEGGYCVASRRGTRHMMEDGYGVITNIHGDSKQAFFGVFDGHGGRAAVDFVSEKLGKNIISAVSDLEGESKLEKAIKTGYSVTDKEFLAKGVSSGACAATVLLKKGELHVSNVGDCRVVMSKKGVATALTRDQCAGREDEKARIESSGGYVTCHNGKWRVQDSLAVSRSIGDMNMKEWVISEPETKKICLTPDCEFLIMASDGLWDKVTNQEAVNVVLQHESLMKSCKDLVEMASRRGSRDDITVMMVDLRGHL